MITITEKAKQRLADALGKNKASFIRILVGRGWGGLSFNLSLDETAKTTDEKFEVDGLTFLADSRAKDYVDGLQIEVQEYYGREGLVAFNPQYGGCY